MTLGNFSKRTKQVLGLVILSVVVLLYAGHAWYQKVYTRPDLVFERMLDNALTTTSVTKQSVVENSSQHVAQSTAFHLSPDPRVHGIVDISQAGDQKSRVRRETLTSTTNNFVRLLSVETEQKNSKGQPYDFSSVQGVWGQTPADESTSSISQLYGQNVAVPYAKLSVNNRKQLIKQIEADGVYEIDYSTIKSVKFNGRTSYEYQVGVKPEAFIKMMKTLGTELGVKGFADVDTANYKNLPTVKFAFTVDVLSAELVKVDYGGGQVETYSGYGLTHIPTDPSNAVSMNELQQRLQKLQN